MRGSRQEGTKHGSSWTAAMWLLLPPLLVLIVLKTGFLPQVARSKSPRTVSFGEIRETGFIKLADKMVHKDLTLGLDGARWQQPHDSVKRETGEDVAAPISKLTCDFSSVHSDVCTMEGDLRIHGKSATVYVVSASTFSPENSTIKVKPYTRKWEKETMSRMREVTMRSMPPAPYSFTIPPRCTVRHDVPTVVFSTGGCGTNFFHAMSDLIAPLYITAREYNGRVQLLITDYQPKWVAKFRPILAALSMYPVIDFDADTVVLCFPSARVGLESHRILGIDPALSRNGYTMMGFRDFLRSIFSLQRPWTSPISRSSGRKPRLVMVLRRHSRAITNEADVITAMVDLGFEVVAAGPKDASDMGRFAGVANSCDVMVGVHGAGLTNMVFLPHNATIVQIIPWGEMKVACRYDFGDPVPDMGLQYAEYEVTAEETTLNEKYPRDHPVFTDPQSLHRQGKLWEIFLEGQNVTLDIGRFREVMQQVYQSVTTE
ncbi:hypothetical protein SEVIR_4G135300v4 [Setaria viridis]